MSRKPVSLLLAVVMAAAIGAALSLPNSAWADLPPGVVKDDYKDIMPLSQVKSGMKGYGLTVFRGTKIEKFNVEVISILRKMNNGKDLILARMIGGPITGRQANIMQGMSGSPVYVNGKIIGAVSYGPGAFSKEPLALLTPIEDMLDSLDPKLPAHPSGLSSIESKIATPVTFEGATMVPLMTPVMVSGISQRGISRLAEIFQPYGLLPMAGPGGKSDVVPAELKPGAAFGLSLATGDVDMTAVGTLTYRRGNKIIGFGHPMFSIGPIDAPLSTAYVHDVFPSYQISSKMASPMKIVGRISQDRPWSVGGEIGRTARTIPLTIQVDDRAIGRKKTLRLNVINHPLLAPKLITLAIAEGINQVHGIPADAMAKVKLEIEADEVGKIARENEFFDPASIEAASLDDMQGLINILSNNRFYPVDVKSVKMSVTILPGRRTATVERILIDKSNYEPGDTINVNVELRPYKAEKFTKTMSLKIPENIPDGRMTLQVKGGMSGGGGGGPMIIMSGSGDDKGGPQMIPSQPGSSAENIRQMLDKFLEREKNNELVARLNLPGSAVSISGEKLSNLPDAIAGVMKSSRSSSTKLEQDEVKMVIPMDYILVGQQSLSIKVERVRHTEKAQPQPPSGGPDQPSDPSAPSPASIGADDSFMDDEPIFSTSAQAATLSDSRRVSGSRRMSGASVRLDESSAPEVIAEGEKSPAPVVAGEDTTAAEPSGAAADGDQSDDKSDAAKKTAEKPVGKQPTVWRQTSYKDFAAGTFNGAAAATSDEIRVVPVLSKLADLPDMYAWKVSPDGKGGAFVGTGNSGIVYRVGADGTSSVFFKTGELEAHALALDTNNNLYVGTSPHGKIFRVDPEGKGSLVYTIPEKYVLSLVCDDKGNVYAGAGDAGKVYKISPEGEGNLFVTLHEGSVLSLATDKSGNLFAGTGRDGIVYRISPDGAASPLYNAAEDSVTSVAVDSKGTVYAGTGSGKGNIYKIGPSGSSEVVYDKAPHALSMAVDGADNVYVASDEQIVKITPDGTVMSLDSGKSHAQFISVSAGADGTLFAGAANAGAVYTTKPAVEATYESPVRDAGVPAKWGIIRWIANAPSGTDVKLQTRTGNVAEPDVSWSAWSASSSTASGESVTSPSARYIQYKATLTGSGSATPVVEQVSLAYLPENRAPKVTINDPQKGSIFSHSAAVKWSGSDPDKDTLTYSIYYSADSGKTWERIGRGVNPSKSTNGTTDDGKKAEPKPEPKVDKPKKTESAAVEQPSKSELMNQLKSELDQHPEIPQDVKDKMIDSAPAAIEKAVSASSDESEPADQGPAGGGSTKQTSYNWDTTKVPDGRYLIKVVASDRVSNATGFMTDEKIIGPVVVANTAPKVETFDKTLKVNGDGSAYVEGYAKGSSVPVAGVQYKVDSGDWMAAAAEDGMFDTASESFSVTTEELTKGNHDIEVKAIDAAGNAASTKVKATVP